MATIRRAPRRAHAASTPPSAAEFERPGIFYLGRPLDPSSFKPEPGLVLYDSSDLVTHAVAVGMTGSGKTGLCISLIEEAALDGIPTIAIDPKGDLGNLLLTFPDLRPEDFRPWVDEEEARRESMPADEYAAQQARLWREGLASWGEDGSRIAKLRAAADFAIYTPGSTAGIPVSILASFGAPAPALRVDEELLQDRVATTATSLLGLLGIQADPVKSREHILLSILFATAWREGRALDLPTLIQQIQSPPVARVGVLDLEAFYPRAERFELATALNNLLAAPGFSTWLEGQPLDIDSILHAADGRPRVAIFSIAHLADAERMFFVSLLLNQVLGWVRSQSGTTDLRALLYMDEIFGYFPPVATPPAKRPLLTLLKQARAFGLGIVLATQNPVDLDYKGLANTGTWFLGRLQTERDKERVLEGLEGAATEANAAFDRQKLDRLLSGLRNRVFLLNNVHEASPVVFESRWAMSYLRGPLTRDQIRQLVGGAAIAAGAPVTPAAPSIPATEPAPPSAPAPAGGVRPVLRPGVPEQFVPARSVSAGAALVYEPRLLAAARVRFADARSAVDTTCELNYLVPFAGGAMGADWSRAETLDVPLADLEREPAGDAEYGPLPAGADLPASYPRWQRDFATWLFRNATLDLGQATPAQRDAVAASLRAAYASRIQRLEEKIRNAEQIVQREQGQERSAQLQTVISVGATLLDALTGRRAVRSGTIGRATTAARGVGRTLEQKQDVERAREDLVAAQAELEQVSSELEQKVSGLDTSRIRPAKSDIEVEVVALAWTPLARDAAGTLTPAWR